MRFTRIGDQAMTILFVLAILSIFGGLLFWAACRVGSWADKGR
jgi:hypothetical protein